ncbi:MAG: oxidoreductase [Actinobacteria bacterium]|uniref:Unannotated protein n=1 Tax=freshwater metagenome TaxID=449393 RepID=A0A6J5Z3J0_9ZZZZ|nr:oxidoreductase [Actinomycetota bacterium]
MSTLFTPLTIGSQTFRNRAWVSPMCQYSAVNGLFQDWHAVHYGAFITGGAGLVMVEATAVAPEGRITQSCLGIWTDKHAQLIAEVPEFAHRHGTKAGIQLAHAGRKGSSQVSWAGAGATTVPHSDGGWQSIAPSAVAFEGYDTPAEMSLSQIAEVTEQFVAAAKRAVNIGFDVIEIHAAHGYLLHEFLSPISNVRTDNYGGSFDNRIRLLCEIATQVRAVVPKDRMLMVRISATDWIDGGWDVEQSIGLARELHARGVEMIDCSSGGLSLQQKIELKPGYQVDFARAIAQATGIPVCAVGLITTGTQAQDIVADGDVSAVMIGRAMLGNPRWPLQAAADLGEEVPWPNQYARGFLKRD